MRTLFQGLVLSIAFLLAHEANAQLPKPVTNSQGDSGFTYTSSAVKSVVGNGIIYLDKVESNLNPVLMQVSGDPDEESPDVPRSLKVKPEVTEDITIGSGRYKTMTAEDPAIFKNFYGYADNQFTPPDNAIAVSNSGYVMSAMNCNYRIYQNDGKLVKYSSFYDLFKTAFPDLTNMYFDPRIIFDPGSKRFIATILHGNTSTDSYVMLLFSKSENPMDGWNLYRIPGDALGKGEWMDYPNIGISNDEVFVTGNQFDGNENFVEPIVLQINKNDGYDGNSKLNYRVWSNIKDASNQPAFTLVPVSYGQGANYGPGIYMICNAHPYGSSVTLFEITDVLSSSSAKIVRNSIAFPAGFAPPYYSAQKGISDQLNSGDARIKQAFLLNGIIHYVFSSVNDQTNNSVIYYGQINVSNKTVAARALGQAGFNYDYPGIASVGTSPTDNSVIIGYLRSGSTIFPEIRAVHCTGNFDFSNSIVVQSGVTYVDVLSNTTVERWGDYTGMARKFSSNSVLFAGCYGNNNLWSTRIAEIGLASTKTSVNEPIASDRTSVEVYPNPVTDIFKIQFELERSAILGICVYDLQGKLVETLYRGHQSEGENAFSFNKAGLPKGIYLLKITADDDLLTTKKITVQ